MNCVAIINKMPRYGYTAIALAVIGYLTLIPHPLPLEEDMLFLGADKLAHGLMFFILVMAWGFDMMRLGQHNQDTTIPYQQLASITVAAMLIGALTELFQDTMNTGRTGDMVDLLADTAGAIAGFAVLSSAWLSFKRAWWQALQS